MAGRANLSVVLLCWKVKSLAALLTGSKRFLLLHPALQLSGAIHGAEPLPVLSRVLHYCRLFSRERDGARSDSLPHAEIYIYIYLLYW